jgi:CxxC motif-containing protein (DUF1111 family)
VIASARPLVAVVVAAAAAAACAAPDEPDAASASDPDRALLGGETTVFDETANAYSRPARNLSSADRDVFAFGDHFFNRNWVAAPASTSANDGLGPLFNATSCSACHLKDGRSRPPQEAGDSSAGLLLRLSGVDATYGGQLQTQAIVGVPVEGEYVITYAEEAGAFADGEPFTLRRPSYEIRSPGYGALLSTTLVSPRTAPSMIGLGLLEAVPEEALVALEDCADRDGDGVSGCRNFVDSPTRGPHVVGRFGWKANVATVEDQVAGAFVGDLGITTRIHPTDGCTSAQAACAAAPTGGAPELSDETLAEVVHYSRCLAVPARRNVDHEDVRAGERLFESAGCAACHATKLTTGEAAPIAALQRQTIRPFTDLLLHDMGAGLADGRPDASASGSEWRTAPLWGLGLMATVSKHTLLMHDGRARDVREAILWHGGEAQRSRDAFVRMNKEERAALLAFLRSL